MILFNGSEERAKRKDGLLPYHLSIIDRGKGHSAYSVATAGRALPLCFQWLCRAVMMMHTAMWDKPTSVGREHLLQAAVCASPDGFWLRNRLQSQHVKAVVAVEGTVQISFSSSHQLVSGLAALSGFWFAVLMTFGTSKARWRTGSLNSFLCVCFFSLWVYSL